MTDSFKLMLAIWAVLFAATTAQAQKLPVPGQKNPDWSLHRKKEPLQSQFRSTDRMPNARFMGPSIIGNHHSYWDSKQQLRYEWESKPDSNAPVDSIIVREEATGTVYTYRRASPIVEPRQWRRTPGK